MALSFYHNNISFYYIGSIPIFTDCQRNFTQTTPKQKYKSYTRSVRDLLQEYYAWRFKDSRTHSGETPESRVNTTLCFKWSEGGIWKLQRGCQVLLKYPSLCLNWTSLIYNVKYSGRFPPKIISGYNFLGLRSWDTFLKLFSGIPNTCQSFCN